MTTVAETQTATPGAAELDVADLRLALRRALDAVAADRATRETYAVRLNAAGNYVLTVRGLSDRARRELLALLCGNRAT